MHFCNIAYWCVKHLFKAVDVKFKGLLNNIPPSFMSVFF